MIYESTMPPRLTYEFVKEFIKNAGDKLLSKEYVNNRTKITIECHVCHNPYDQVFTSYQKGYRHQDCPNKVRWENSPNPLVVYNANPTRKILPLVTKTCPECNEQFDVKNHRRDQITCSPECLKVYIRKKAESGHYRRIGSMGGKISAAMQTRRSKNEILFAELCEEHFTFDEVVCNEPMFEGWDADIILKKLKIAILWNGVWHYKKVREGHNLAQVQSRDKIKMKIIKKLGFIPYVVKDMGSWRRKFVLDEFKKLQDFVYFV